ncbi:UDP-N-acetylmuramate--L-alanine ligase [Candidatus Peregrinibacteria bacterium CG_4_10_14_0_2_um_filter_43_11]|nr:MAG: UDP-N-acetylmuramate--L-alanine ligase [Candidatus Peregrinibacteria bacterium CG_4_10_14_0_2_um_filter_43_11]
MFRNYHHIHFIGIGGSGISALAHLALAEGKRVTGSDGGESLFTHAVREAGGEVMMGHHADHVSNDVDLVIYTEAIDKTNNPELEVSNDRRIKTMTYFQALGEFSATKKTIVVAGTHGKTTTTAMLGLALIKAGMDPTVIVGSAVPAFGGKNLSIGIGDWLVVEACEYRRSFLNLHPFGAIVLNCEPDHLDYYKDEADYVDAFCELIRRLPSEGFLVGNGTDENVRRVANEFVGKTVFVAEEMVDKMNFHLQVPGAFNRWNATHAYTAAELAGGDAMRIRQGIEDFKGTSRRMEVKGETNGITIIDDYGHHPTEVKATLGALKEHYPNRRLICVFQPHQYSRTHELLAGFKTAFGDATKVIIPNIYAARDTEEDKAKINAEMLVKAIGEHHPDVVWGKDFETTVALLQKEAKPGDVIVTMGAGNITQLSTLLCENKDHEISLH